MSLFERMERRLERTVNGAFARAFRSEVQPLELASALRRAMDDRATLLGKGRTVVPNVFTIELSPTDHERLTEYEDDLREELLAAAEEHAESQRYRPGGPLQVMLEEDEALETGVFRVRPATSRQPVAEAAPRARNEEPAELAGEQYAEHGYDEHSSGDLAADGGDEGGRYDEGGRFDQGGRYDEGDGDDEPTRPHHPEPIHPQPSHREPPRRAAVEDRPWLEIDGERYPLMGAMTVLGRDETADVVLDDPGISRRHCEVRVTHDGPRLVTHLRDLASTNGTYVNGEATDAQRLADGDRISVGRTDVLFRVRRG